MQTQDWRMLRDLLLIFGLIFFVVGLYISASAAGTGDDWNTLHARALATAGWDVGLFTIAFCSVATALVFDRRMREEELLAS